MDWSRSYLGTVPLWFLWSDIDSAQFEFEKRPVLTFQNASRPPYTKLIFFFLKDRDQDFKVDPLFAFVCLLFQRNFPRHALLKIYATKQWSQH